MPVRMKGLTSHVTVSRLSMSVCFLSVCECSDKSTQNSLMWRELELLCDFIKRWDSFSAWEMAVCSYQEVGQFQCVGNGSLFSHILCILLVHIELHKMCDLQTAGSHLIVCNSIFVYHAVLQYFARIIRLQTHPGENALTAYNPCHNTFQVHL